MRKVTWIVLILIMLLWLAIAHFWTGNKNLNIEIPDPNAAIEVPVTLIPSDYPTLAATPSATPTQMGSTTSATPLRY